MADNVSLTYRDILEQLNALTEEQLNMTVTVKIMDEYFPIEKPIQIAEDCDVLDKAHPFFAID